MIPKKLHMIWIGNPAKRPTKWIATWKDAHPEWQFKLYGNKELLSWKWRLRPQMDYLLSKKKFAGVADLMRYEILYEHGGVYVDADCECKRPLDELLGLNAFAAYEHELEFPGLIANATIGAEPKNPVIGKIINDIEKRRNPLRIGKRRYWLFGPRNKDGVPMTVGPMALTRAITQIGGFVILPSCAFYPYWHDGTPSPIEDETVYAHHHWGTSTASYRENYEGQPKVPVDIWAQQRAIEQTLEIAQKESAPSEYVDALTAALWTIRGHQVNC